MVLLKKTDYDAKITDIEGKIPDVSNLVTKTALENKIPSVSSLVEKTDYNAKITEIKNKLNNHNHDKYMTTPEFNALAADVFNARFHGQIWWQKQILMLNYQVLTKGLLQIKQNTSC